MEFFFLVLTILMGIIVIVAGITTIINISVWGWVVVILGAGVIISAVLEYYGRGVA